jgi:arabinose-5-phosphate isomerase
MNDITSAKLIEQARAVFKRETDALASVEGQLDSSLSKVIYALFDCPGHILVTGAGTSRAVAQRFAHLLACCGSPGLFVNAADALHGGAGAVTANEVLFVISKGGRSSEINNFVKIAKDKGAKIIALTETNESPLADMCDAIYKIKAPADADPYGMIATGSSLVNSAACDVLCVLLLQMRGYSKEQFAVTHPEGAVGRKLEEKA